jgi:hypothetical protein
MRRPLNRPSPLVGHFEKHLAKLRVIALFGKPRALVCVLLVIFDYYRHQSPSHQRVRNLPVANPAYGPFVAIDVPTVQGSASRLCDARSSACDGHHSGASQGELVVSFQQIVHPVLTEETEVAEASDSEGKPDEHA